jgi:hypothetical protein
MHRLYRPVALLLSAVLSLAPVFSAQAAMVGTPALLDSAQSQQTRASLQQLLNRQEAQQQLLALGVNPDEAKARIASLSDSELARINQGIGQLDAGSDSVLGILLIIFIVFVITDVIGATDIFPFIHPVN